MYLFSRWLLKASSYVVCLSNAVNRLEQHTWMCQDSFGCWGQNCVDLSLVSTISLVATVSCSAFSGKGKSNSFEAF